jgi:hypothetical protein
MSSKVPNVEVELVGMDPNSEIKSAALWMEGYLMTMDARTSPADSEFSAFGYQVHINGF